MIFFLTDDLQIKKDNTEPSVHFLVLTDIHGNKTYATCISFYRPYVIEKVGFIYQYINVTTIL